MELVHGVGSSTSSMISRGVQAHPRHILADMKWDSSMSLQYLWDRLVVVQLDLFVLVLTHGSIKQGRKLIRDGFRASLKREMD